MEVFKYTINKETGEYCVFISKDDTAPKVGMSILFDSEEEANAVFEVFSEISEYNFDNASFWINDNPDETPVLIANLDTNDGYVSLLFELESKKLANELRNELYDFVEEFVHN